MDRLALDVPNLLYKIIVSDETLIMKHPWRPLAMGAIDLAKIIGPLRTART